MISSPLRDRGTLLFVFLVSFMAVDAVIAEFTGTKIFSLEKTLDIDPIYFNLWGMKLSLDLTAGVVFWPLVFVITDLINEYFGRRGVYIASFLTASLIGYAFLCVNIAMNLEPSEFWIIERLNDGTVINREEAFQTVFKQSGWIMLGSITAFLIGQLLDALSFYLIKLKTGERMLWIRATGSTAISQLVDSFVVIYIAFGIGSDWSMVHVIAVATLNYIYKIVAAIAVTPLIYIAHWIIELYLGKSLAYRLKASALKMS